MIELRQSTAGQEVPLGYFLDSSDGNTEETGLSIANTDIKIWKWGATTLANKNSGGATHISNGVYYCTLDATDTDTLGALVIFVHVSGALVCRLECAVVTQNYWDSKYSTDKLQVDAVEISGDSVAADNLESVLDGSGITNDVDLTARSLTITNDAGVGVAIEGTTIGMSCEGTNGSGLKVSSSGGNGLGLWAEGNGSGEGIQARGGTTGHGLEVVGGATSGNGLNATATTSGTGISATGAGTGDGMKVTAGAGGSGNGLRALGGSGGGDGIHAEALGNNEHGIHLTGDGTGKDINASEIDGIKAVTDNLPNSGALTDIDTGVNNIEAKLPTNYIMGSSDQTDKDDDIDAILLDTNELQTDDVPGLIGALNDVSAAEVNAEVLDVLNTDTFAEPGQEAPAATNTLVKKIGYIFKFLRNKIDNDGSTIQVYDDAGSTVDQKSTVSEAGGTVTRGEFGSGP